MKTETIDRIRRFTEERDWDKFHSPSNLAKSISIEANELLECFQWSDTDYDIAHVKEELADVLVYCRNMLDKLGLDEDEIVNAKMDQNEAKYPVEKARGKSDKYTEL
ncbi:MAG: nucleotide pyrophosphohydrolase [Clostridiales bacterium]|nr:nucleotide pyrophosphohydrolase [Clostridiales bacterium]